MGFGSFFKRVTQPVRKIVSPVVKEVVKPVVKTVATPVAKAVSKALNVDTGPSPEQIAQQKRADQQLAAQMKKVADQEKKLNDQQQKLANTATSTSRARRSRRGGSYRLLLSSARKDAATGIKGSASSLGG